MPPADPRIVAMSTKDKIGEAMRRSLPKLPADARAMVQGMLTPASLAIIAATLVGWLAAQAFGVGEILDLILLIGGVIMVGWQVFSGARDLFEFAKLAVNARNDSDLDEASTKFAEAVVILGVAVVQTVLMKGSARAVAERGIPKVRPRLDVGEPPAPGNQLRVSRVPRIPSGSAGYCDMYGVIVITREQSLTEQQLTLYHELIHRYFSPRTGPLREFRAALKYTGYEKSAFLRYLEEAMAEGYAQLKVRGLGASFRGFTFPIKYGYVTIADVQAEGAFIGSIIVGGTIFHVTISGATQ